VSVPYDVGVLKTLSQYRAVTRSTAKRLLASRGYRVSRVGRPALMDLLEALSEAPQLLTVEDRQAGRFLFEGLSLLQGRGIRPLSQLGQDAWILGAHKDAPGFFLEIGAGKLGELSNTQLLQSVAGWSGVVVEPLPEYAAAHRQARENTQVRVIEAAIATSDGQAELVPDGELSSLLKHHQSDGHAASRQRALQDNGSISVRTISPASLISEADIPPRINFLSLDVEGAELEILQNFPWDHAVVEFACIEHNHRKEEREIDDLMLNRGLIRVLRGWTGFDGWYMGSTTGVN
jgi:FkbM family methyltransferase